MLVVETIAQIRRAYFVQKKPIKLICREYRLSRKVVRKVIRSEATEFHYERGRQPLPRIDPWREQLEAMRLANESKPGRERLTLKRVFEELCGLGYPRETQEMVFEAHNRAFAFFKGTDTRGIYDNMKTAVETVFIAKDRQFNRRFLPMCGHYLVEPTALPAARRPPARRPAGRRARACPRESGGREPGRGCARALLHATAAGRARSLSSGGAERGPGGGVERLAA